MNAMLEFTSGRCTNELFCAVASAGDVVRVPVGARFVCAYCGSKLIEHAPHRRRIGMRKGMIVGGGMGAAGIAMFAIGYFLGNAPAPTDRAAAPAAETAPEAAQKTAQKTAQIAAPLTTAPTPQTTETARAAAATSDAPTVSVVAQQPAEPSPPFDPAVSAAPESSAPASPADLQPALLRPSVMQKAPAKLQTSQSAMTQSAAPLILAMAERPLVPAVQHDTAKIRPAPVARVTADAASVASAHLSALLQAPPAPTPAPTQAPAPADSDSLNQAEAAKLAAPPRQVAIAAPPAPILAGPTRGFAPRAVQGGAPTFPAAYEGEDRTGRVTVKCRIEASGAPTACQVVASHGGRGFDISVLNWLGGGRVRFAPILHNGQAIAETHQWSVDFQPGGG